MTTTCGPAGALQADLERLRAETERFRAGTISEAEFRGTHTPLGIYEQRRSGSYMLRVRLPGGVVAPEQMRVLAAAAGRHGSGLLHLTTRQDIQVHDVPLENIRTALAELAAAGLFTKGGGGNTVRNVTTCPGAGICAGEVFDVAPHALALTEFLLADPSSFALPRKYKVAFSGCPRDCAGAIVNDLGFIARKGADGGGFAVYAGGGLGARSRIGELLEPFVPAGEVGLVAEAVKQVFDRHGDRENRHRARLRFLIEKQGFARFRELYAAELERLRGEAPRPPQPREMPPPAERPLAPAQPAGGFEAWRRGSVRAQRQPGYFGAEAFVFLGDVAAGTFERLAASALAHGDGLLRVTQSQNLAFRWLREGELPGLHRELAALGLAGSPPPVVARTAVCTGAATCKLGLCLSQELAGAIRDELERAGLDLEAASDLRLHINGCPNSCGRHPIASIGLSGAVRRTEEGSVPHYVVQLGGRLGEGRTTLAEGKEALPARSVPRFLAELLGAFRESGQYPDFDAWLEAGGRDEAARLAARWRQLP